MKTSPVTVLKRGDRIRFANSGRVYELARDPQIHSFEHALRVLSFTGDLSGVEVPADTNVTVARMIRPVPVRCLIHRGDVTVRVDLATETVPRAVLCGDCDAKVTAEVMAQMAAREEPVEDNTGEVPFSDYVPEREPEPDREAIEREAAYQLEQEQQQ